MSKCTCHLKLEECRSPIYSTKGGLYRKPSELMKCGKVKEELIKKVILNNNDK